MSVRAFVGVLAALCLLSPLSTAEAADPSEPCFGGLVTETDRSGLLSGSECSDVIVASTETTSIQGGNGKDVIIGGDNVILIEGGNGDDYIIGDSNEAVLMGGAGDDIIDAGPPPSGEGFSKAVEDHLALAAALLPDDEGKEFLETVEDALASAQDEDRTVLDPELRSVAIQNSALVQQVMNPTDVVLDDRDEELMAEIEALRSEAQDYAESVKAFAERESDSSASGAGETEPLNLARAAGCEAGVWMYGGRGNDTLDGGAGNDQLYGGVGDDTIRGRGCHDYMLGGMGSDKLDGGAGNDVAQGDATGDKMIDSGTSTGDVLSYASGGTPGFPGVNMSVYPNFPSAAGERGVYVDLTLGIGNNGTVVGAGGGNDPADPNWDDGTEFSDFEHVIGTPFADVIIGDSGNNVLQGGGGSDLIRGGGGTDVLIGEAGGDNLVATGNSWISGGQGDDYCAGAAVIGDCEPAMPSNWVSPRNTGAISVGMTSPTYAGNVKSQLYLAGSTGNWVTETGADNITVTQHATPPGSPPIFTFTASSTPNQGQFSLATEDQTPGCSYTATLVTCTPATNVVTMVLAGFGSNDNINIVNVSKMTSTVFVGGDGHDTLTGGNYAEDFMHGGDGDDLVRGMAADDGLVNTAGADEYYGGDGDDLILSDVACQADTLGGGAGDDNASWAMFRADQAAGTVHGVFASIVGGVAGRNVGASLDCSGLGPAIHINGFEDLEGSRHNDALYGGPGNNGLLGRGTPDRLTGYGGADTHLANAADDDNIFCGAGSPDVAIIDYPAFGIDWDDGNCQNVIPRLPQYGGV